MNAQIRSLIVLSFAVVSTSTLSAQVITITAADVRNQMVPGNTLVNHNDSVTTSLIIGAPGASSWDFSGLKSSAIQTLTSVPVAGTPFVSQFPGSTHAFQTTVTVNFSGTNVTGTAYQYLKLGTHLLNPGLEGSGQLIPGLSGTITNTNVPIDTMYFLPLTLGTTWRSAYTATSVIALNGAEFQRTTKSHAITYVADAYGPMVIPGGSVHQALRFRKVDINSVNTLVGYMFLARDGASVQMLAADVTQPDNGLIRVVGVQWTGASITLPPEMALSPGSFNVGPSAGTVYARVINMGDGALTWSTTDNDGAWLVSGNGRKDTIAIAYGANTATAPRTGTVTVTSNGVNSPLTITVTQEGVPILPVLDVRPAEVHASWQGGSSEISIRNAGNGSLSWKAESDQTWAAIAGGAAGVDSGKVTVSLSANASTVPRTATITVTSSGAAGSPGKVTITQDSCEAPGVPTLLSPASGETIRADTVRLRWHPGVRTASTYWLESAVDSPGARVKMDSTLTITSSTLRGLVPGMTYWWHVREKNPTGWGPFGVIRKFSRLLNTPGAVTLVSPADDSYLAGDTVRLIWKRSAPPVNGYCLELAADSTFTSGFADSSLTDSAYIARRLLKGTSYWWRVKAGNLAGWGIYSQAWKFSLSLTWIARHEDVPESFQLYQNFPNPFNPSTTILYSLPERSSVVLTVVNPLGQQVAELARGDMERGLHEARFDGTGLASGIYFCKLMAGRHMATRAMLYMK